MEATMKKRKNKQYNPNWGGRREPGPGKRLGRPPVAGVLQRKTVTLPDYMVKVLEDIGEGNLSAGIRTVYNEHIAEDTGAQSD
jgi:hypothetical protein